MAFSCGLEAVIVFGRDSLDYGRVGISSPLSSSWDNTSGWVSFRTSSCMLFLSLKASSSSVSNLGLIVIVAFASSCGNIF